MTDNGLAALAEALTDVQGGAYASWLKRAPAILGERGVFLPEGLDAADLVVRLRRTIEEGHDVLDAQRDEIAALRAAPLDVRMVVQAINAVAKRHGVAKDPPERPLMHIFGYTSATPDMDAEIAAEYAALAAAKEATDGA